MKKSIVAIVLVAFCVSMFLVASTAFAGEVRRSSAQANGDVKLVKDEKGEISALKIGDREVILDDMGKDLAALMIGKRTEASGTLDDDKKLVLKRFSIDVVANVKKAEKGYTVTAGGISYDVQDKRLEKFDGKQAQIMGTVILDRENAKKLTIKGLRPVKTEEKKDG